MGVQAPPPRPPTLDPPGSAHGQPSHLGNRSGSPRPSRLAPDSAVPRLPRSGGARPPDSWRRFSETAPGAPRAQLGGPSPDSPPPPDGRRHRAPRPRGLRPSSRGSPCAHTLRGPAGHSAQEAGPRPSAPPHAGRAPGPTLPGRRPGAGLGGEGDWAAARGRALGREARRPPPLSAPAPPSPPSLLAPRRPRSALSPRRRRLPRPGPSPSRPRPLLPPPPSALLLLLLPRAPGGAGETERWLRGGVTGSRGSEPRTPSRDRGTWEAHLSSQLACGFYISSGTHSLIFAPPHTGIMEVSNKISFSKQLRK
ncbi:LHFPL tetraspan subfamily member 2 protein isoform X2 [Bubalus bubalis]|uniref:LHFPL tetraspan subfamily member 2 protein isoform X2 n=1 Tax=Bubalus bubalis TaxID=89462 RepID=UPI001D12E8C5|nr:LHFPL tetraspan subfamily member 2 protein isoform X2 [Bubalus bubalis]